MNYLPDSSFTYVKHVNSNFLIRYSFTRPYKLLKSLGCRDSSIGLNLIHSTMCAPKVPTYLIGAGNYSLLVGSDIANKHFKQVLNSSLDVTTFLLRRGLKIDFVSR